MKIKPDRLTVLFDRVGPYHFERLRATGQRVPTAVIEMSATDDTYAWDRVIGADCFTRVTLFDDANTPARFPVEAKRRVHSALDLCRPAVVAIPGWSDRGALSALQWCVERGVPTVIMSDSTEWDDKRVFWKELVKKRVVRLASAGLVAGTPHADYISALGLARGRVFTGYDAIDNEYFEKAADDARRRDADLRKEFGLPKAYFLASARFVEKKNLLRLIEAYARYRAQTRGSQTELRDLVLLGDGPQREEIRRKIETVGMSAHILLPGFKQYRDLPVYYGLADAFVHASTTEQWGLVVNEAMASGLPVLVSNRCGCAMDLVKEGVTGFSFDPWNVDELADLMLRCTNGEVNLATMGRAARTLIADWGVDRFAEALTQAAETAKQVPLRKMSVADRLLLEFLLWKSRVNR